MKYLQREAWQVVQQLWEILVCACTHRLWLVFGDSAFALDTQVQCMLKGMHTSILCGKAFNITMACTLVANEHIFSELLNQWGLVGHRSLFKLSSMQSMHMHVAVLLRNIQVIWYGSQTELSFGGTLQETLTVQSLLARAL